MRLLCARRSIIEIPVTRYDQTSWIFLRSGLRPVLGGAAAVAVYLATVADLPDYAVLSGYEPPVTTRACRQRRADGRVCRGAPPVHSDPGNSRSRQGRVPVGGRRNFYQHPGIDVTGFGRAVVAYLTGGPTQGGSTITQQVAKNFCCRANRPWSHKARRSHSLLPYRAGLQQGQDPRTLSERKSSSARIRTVSPAPRSPISTSRSTN